MNQKYLGLAQIFLSAVDEILAEYIDDATFGVAQLCRKLNISQPQLYRKIKAASGQSTVQYMRSYRLARGKALLKNSNLSVTEVAYQVGFSDPAYFSRMFSKEYGVPPSKI